MKQINKQITNDKLIDILIITRRTGGIKSI